MEKKRITLESRLDSLIGALRIVSFHILMIWVGGFDFVAFGEVFVV